MIEKLTIQKLPKEEYEYSTIIIRTGISSKSFQVVLHNLSVIGDVHKVLHYRVAGEYLTLIKGEMGSIAVLGDLTSGFKGSGPSGSIELMKHLGFEENHVESLFYNHEYENALITLIREK